MSPIVIDPAPHLDALDSLKRCNCDKDSVDAYIAMRFPERLCFSSTRPTECVKNRELISSEERFRKQKQVALWLQARMRLYN